MTTTADVAVLGAGPYGLSTHAHLNRSGARVRIFGDPMSTWREHMPTGMYLKSTPPASSIAAGRRGYALEDYCRAAEAHMPVEHEPVPLDLFTAYGRWFAETLAPEVEQTEVTFVDRVGGDRLRVETRDGEHAEVRSVVVASGLIGHAYIPPVLAALSAEGATLRDGAGVKLVSHSCEHVNLSVFAGLDVAVVGAGQSALESAALLTEAGARPTVFVRKTSVVYGGSPFAPPPTGLYGLYEKIPKPQGPLGPGWPLLAFAKGPAAFRRLPDAARLDLVARILGPAGAWWLRERVEGKIPVRLGSEVIGAAAGGGRVALRVLGPDGEESTVEADHVICATGYRIGPDSFPFLSARIREALAQVKYWPRLGPGFESSIPGLFFVGFPSAGTFGPLMRFVCGTAYSSPRVARAVLDRAGL